MIRDGRWMLIELLLSVAMMGARVVKWTALYRNLFWKIKYNVFALFDIGSLSPSTVQFFSYEL